MRATWRVLARHRDLRLVLSAGLVSLTGDWTGMVIVGLPGALTTAGLITLFQRNTGDSYGGRVFGAGGAMEGAAIVAGTMAAGYLGQAAGIIPVLAFPGGRLCPGRARDAGRIAW